MPDSALKVPIAILALLLLLPAGMLFPYAATLGSPTVTDYGNGTAEAVWDLSTAGDYALSSTVLSSGKGLLDTYAATTVLNASALAGGQLYNTTLRDGSVVLNSSSSSIISIFGDLPGETLGTNITWLDYNGDGVDDLAIGAPYANLNGSDTGAVFIFYGPLPLRNLNASEADVVLTGSMAGEKFGSVLCACDTDGDGSQELVIGSPGYDSGRGRLSVFTGASVVWQDDLENGTPGWGENTTDTIPVWELSNATNPITNPAGLMPHSGYSCWETRLNGTYPAGEKHFWLHTPVINLSLASHPWLSFWAHMELDDNDVFEVRVSTDGGISYNYTVASFVNPTYPNSGAGEWERHVIDLSDFRYCKNLTIAFHGYDVPGGGGSKNIAIDDVSIVDSPGVVGIGLPESKFGSSLAAVDMDGDGAQEVLVGAPGSSSSDVYLWRPAIRDFSTDFSGISGWYWYNEPRDMGGGDSGGWSLSNGWLNITTNKNTGFYGVDNAHMLYRNITGDFMLTARVRAAPSLDGQKAGIVIRADGNNLITLDREYSGGGLVRVNYMLTGRALDNGGTPFAGDTIYLRMARIGGTIKCYHSVDGASWTSDGTYGLPFNSTVMAGIFAADGGSGTNFNSSFDYCRIEALPEGAGQMYHSGNASGIGALLDAGDLDGDCLVDVVAASGNSSRSVLLYGSIAMENITYTFADGTHTAYESNKADGQPPGALVISGENQITDDTPLLYSDDDVTSTNSANFKSHRFLWSVDGENITAISFLWEGYASEFGAAPIIMYIWDYIDGRWVALNATGSSTDTVLYGNITSEVYRYISGGEMSTCVVSYGSAGSPKSLITDYVELTLTRRMPVEFDLRGPVPSSLSVGDANNDGFDDIMFGFVGTSTAEIYRGNFNGVNNASAGFHCSMPLEVRNNNASSTLNTSYTLALKLNTTAWAANGLILPDGSDMRVAYYNASARGWTLLPCHVRWSGTNRTTVFFRPAREIPPLTTDGNYTLLYNASPDRLPPQASWSDSMGADALSRVYLAADDFEEHNSGDTPDGWYGDTSSFSVAIDGGNKVLETSATQSYLYASKNIRNMTYYLDFRVPGPYPQYFGPRMRYTDSTHYVGFGVGTSSTELYGGWRDGGSFNFWRNFSVSDMGSSWHTLCVKSYGNTFSFYYDGIFMGNFSLPAGHLTSGYAGILSMYNNGNTVYYDNAVLTYLTMPEPTVSGGISRVIMNTLYSAGAGAAVNADNGSLAVSSVLEGKVYLSPANLSLNDTWIDISAWENLSSSSPGYGSAFSISANPGTNKSAVSSPLDGTYAGSGGRVYVYRDIYVDNGTCTTPVADMGSAVFIDDISWVSFVPSGTRMWIYARTGNTTSPDGSWTGWVNISSLSVYTQLEKRRFIQLRAEFVSDGGILTPWLYEISVSHHRYMYSGYIETGDFTPAQLDRWVSLEWSASVPAGCGLYWNFSTDGGASWTPTQGDLLGADNSTGRIRLRATLVSSTGLATPYMDRFTLRYHTSFVLGPPLVKFTSPSAEGLYTGTLPLSVSASADVTAVDFYYYVDIDGDGSADDGNSWMAIGTDNAAPFQVPWDSSTISGGSVLLRAIAHDSEGLDTTVQIRVFIDNIPPSIAIVAPQDGETVTRTVSIGLTYSSDTVSLHIHTQDGRDIYSGSASSSVQWDTTGWSDGDYTITAVATDGAGLTGQASIAVKVDNTPPVLSIVSPQDGDTVRGTVTLLATSNEQLISEKWEYSAGNSKVTVTDASPQDGVQWDTSGLNGTVRLIYSGYDGAGHRGEASIEVSVDNAPPSVTVEYPSDGEIVSGMVPLSLVVSLDTVQGSLSWHSSQGDEGQINITIDNGTITAFWNTTSIENDTVVLVLNVTDASGNTVSYAWTVTVDNTAPAIRILNPRGGSAVTGSVDVAFSHSPDTAQVSFYYAQAPNESSIMSVERHPVLNWTSRAEGHITWDTGGMDMVDVALIAVAVDRAGNTNTTWVWPIVIDNTAPTVSILSLRSGDHITGTVAVNLSYSPDVAAVVLEYYIDANADGTANDGGEWHIIDSGIGEQWEWDTAGMNYPSILLRASVTDRVGLTASDTLKAIEVDNTPPDCSFVYPTDGVGVPTVVSIEYSCSSDVTEVVLQYGTGGEWTTAVATTDVNGTIVWDNSLLGSEVVDLRIVVRDEVALVGDSTVSDIVLGKTPPVIVRAIPDITLEEDSPPYMMYLSSYVVDSDSSEPPGWYITGVNTNLYMVSGEGTDVLTIMPVRDAWGSSRVTLRAVDSDGLSATQQIWINITPVNDPPVFRKAPDIMVHYDYDYIFNFTPYISDVDTPMEMLTLTTSDPDNIRVEHLTCIFNYSKEYLNTTQYVTLTVGDGEDYSSTIISVEVTTDWVPEVRKQLPDVVLEEGETREGVFDLDDYFFDKDKDALYFSYGYTHITVTIHENHSVDMSAESDWHGVEFVTFRATDPAGALVEDIITVTVLNVNDPPVLDPLPDLTVHYDADYTFDLSPYVSDPDNRTEDLRVWTSMPAYAHTSTDDNMLLVLNYPQMYNGSVFNLTVYVSDGIDTVSRTINVTVSDNWPPVKASQMPDISFPEDTYLRNAINLSMYFYDPDGNILYYSYGHTHINITIDSRGLVSFSAEKDWYGTDKATFRAVDPRGGLVEQTITITVWPVNDPPVILPISDRNITAGEEFSIDLRDYVYDVDDPINDLTFTVSSDINGTEITIGGTVVVVRYPVSSGTDHLDIRVRDPAGAEANITVTVHILSPSEPSPSGSGDIWGYLWILILLAVILGAIVIYATYGRFWGPFSIMEVYLIHEDTGIMLSHIAWTESAKDKDLVSGMFTAIQSFVEDAFQRGGEGGLKSLEVGDVKILVERENGVYLAVIYDGHATSEMKSVIKNLMEEVMEHYGAAIARFHGSRKGLKGLDELIRGKLAPYAKDEKTSLKEISGTEDVKSVSGGDENQEGDEEGNGGKGKSESKES